MAQVGDRQRFFPPFRGPAQFAAGTRSALTAEEFFVGPPPGVAQAQPDEVKDFMHENARKFALAAVERDVAAAQERARVNSAMAIPQAGPGNDADGPAV